LLTDIGSKSRWVIGGTANCNAKDADFLVLEVGNGSVTWTNGSGKRSIERILGSDENAFRTESSGVTWAYARNGGNIDAQASDGGKSLLTRCP
jgi:hypothetical protein